MASRYDYSNMAGRDNRRIEWQACRAIVTWPVGITGALSGKPVGL